MGSTHKLAVLATTASVAASLAACGSQPGLSRAQLASKADAICTAAQSAAHAVAAPANLLDVAAAAAYFDKIAPITDRETSQLEALTPDGAAAADWKAFIAAQKAANGLLQRIRRAADARNAAGLQDLRGVPAAGNRVIAAASTLGAQSCAQ